MKVKSLEQFQKELKNTDKDKIIEMLYYQGVKLILIERRLKGLLKVLEEGEDEDGERY